MKVQMVAIGRVKPYDKNPRKNDKAVDAVAESLKEFGWQQPLVVDAKMVLIVGHTRLLAAQKLKMKRVPVVVAKGLSPEQVRAYRIGDNRTGEISEWDMGLLADELRELTDQGFAGLGAIGIDAQELDALLGPLAEDTQLPARATLGQVAAAAAPEDGPGDDDQGGDGEEPQGGGEPIGDDEDEDEEDQAEDEEDDELDVETDSIQTYREDAVFSSSNWLGFPDLLPDRLWDGTIRRTYCKDDDTRPTQLICWSSVGVDERMRGHVVAFYAHDERFESAIWDRAVGFLDKMRVIKPAALVMPDFSTWTDEPTAFNIWNTYRSRWCARYWQEAGHQIIPNINLCDKASWRWIFMGLPKEIPCAMIQVRQNYNESKASKKLLVDGIHEWCKRIKTRKIFIYGGEHRTWLEPHLPAGVKYVWLTSYHRARKDAGLF